MLRSIMITSAVALLALGACGRTDDGDVVIERPGDVDVRTTKDTLRTPDIDIGTQKDTLIVNKPVIRHDDDTTHR